MESTQVEHDTFGERSFRRVATKWVDQGPEVSAPAMATIEYRSPASE
jgi:hypothetical protein